jgi:hypothetical protein
MSGTYRYTGKPYSSFSSSLQPQFSAANSIVVTIKTPTVLPPGLPFGDVPPGTLVSIGDGGRQYDDVPPGVGEDITLSVQLSTDPAGEIAAWNIDLKDDGFEIEGPPITTSYEIHTSGGLPKPATPIDESKMSLDPTPWWAQGMTGVSGDWSRQ